MKNELGGKIMTTFVVLMTTTYTYRKVDKMLEAKHCKDTKKSAVSEGLVFDVYKTSLLDDETIKREQILSESRN